MHIKSCLNCGKLMEGVYDKRVKYHPECIPVCKMEGCKSKIYHADLGLCQKHYMRWSRGQPETNPCKGCGVIIDSRRKWCSSCKALHLDMRGRRKDSLLGYCPEVGNNADCPKRTRCNIEGCFSPEELDVRKRELFGGMRTKTHPIQSNLYYEPKTFRASEYGKAVYR